MRGSGTWMLFEGGDAARVDLSVYSSPKGGNRPIDAYVVTECEGDFTAAARRASEAVFHVTRRYFSDESSVVIGYDLGGVPGESPLSGESGGLAFALALAKVVLKQDPGPVAATGEITSGSNGGPVGAVKGVEAKLTAAGTVMSDGGWVLYPTDNDREVSGDLRKTLSDKGLRMVPVSSVAHALELLFTIDITREEHALQPSRRGNRHKAAALLILACAVVGAAIWKPLISTLSFQNEQPPEKIHPVSVAPGGLEKKLSENEPAMKPEIMQTAGPRLVTISGETFFTRTLADRLTVKLSEYFNHDLTPRSLHTNLSGTLTMVRIVEDSAGDTGGLRSQMTLKLKDLSFKAGDSVRVFPPLTVNVRGPGPASALVPKAAEALFDEITRLVATEKE
jgi:hypothetical protein